MSLLPRVGNESESAPASPDAWKRAIHKRAPRNFRVELLPPENYGSSHSYGFRIYAIKDDDRSVTTRVTSSGVSIASMNDYDIWRKWEDCLLFQDSLEAEYSVAARAKRKRLAAGKGVKKNGVYIHSDQAASWESLPFGPDPNDIAHDIHEYIPKLSKKGTFFRASQETVAHRYEELQMMMQALLSDDLPTLIKDIKATSTFTDFFGIWGRDVDLARKLESAKKQSTLGQSRTSLTTSILSAFPLSSSAKPLSPNKGKAPETVKIPLHGAHSDSSSSEDHVDPPRAGRSMDRARDIRSMRSRGSSSGSYSSSSSPSTPVTMPRQLPPTSRQPVIASQEVPIRYGHNPHVPGGDGSPSILESLPEDRELSSSPKSDLNGVWTRKRSESAASKINRTARVFPTPPSPLQSSDQSPGSLCRYSTVSLQSTHSSMTLKATAYLDELGVDYCLPSPTPEPRRHPRASVSSLASVVTNTSVDAVIPRNERPARSASNVVRPLSLPEESYGDYVVCSDDESQFEDQEDILDVYFNDLIRPPSGIPDGYPETPTADETTYRFSPQSSTSLSSFSGYSDRRSSFATSVSSGSTASTGSGDPMMLSIKATHEDNIVLLRLPRYVTFDELRRKIYDKFIQTDKSTICKTFAIALSEQPPAKVAGGRPRAGSLSSLGSTQSKGVPLYFISSPDKWDQIAATHHGKMFLRIIGSRE